MLFKNPSILYVLFTLLIPIFIHLFKLRKFQKTPFTNVAFLEKIKLQTRKSSQLKKWLVLLSRLLLLTAAILAFAEPYLPSKTDETKPELVVIYLDNSFSMQAKAENGPLLKRAVQQLIESIEDNQYVSLFTNNEVYRDVPFSEIKNEILDIDYCEEQLTPEQLNLKYKQLSKDKPNNQFVIISDFQEKKQFNYNLLAENNSKIIQLVPQNVKNVSLDSLWISKNSNEHNLHITASAFNYKDNLAVSVKNQTNLIGKATLNFKDNDKQHVTVPINIENEISGQISLVDNGLTYDNTRYFSVNNSKKLCVLSINGTQNDFLKRIYKASEFKYFDFNLSNLNYAKINEADAIILNEINSIPKPLIQSLKTAIDNGTIICVIPPKQEDESYVEFLNNFNVAIGTKNKTEKRVTNINFSHPLYKDVFTKTVQNFQYPTIKESFKINGGDTVLSLEDESAFLVQSENLYIFASSLSKEISNFKQSPLIVPTLYNIAKSNAVIPEIEYKIGKDNKIKIEIEHKNQDNILEIKGENEQFIPLQQVYKNHVQFETNELPKNAGNYKVTNKNTPIYSLSFNYGNTESKLQYYSFENSNKTVSNSVSTFFNDSNAQFEITELWKWFLIFALVFLGIEILLLKFLK